MNAENTEKNIWDQLRSLTQIQVRLLQGGGINIDWSASSDIFSEERLY